MSPEDILSYPNERTEAHEAHDEHEELHYLQPEEDLVEYNNQIVDSHSESNFVAKSLPPSDHVLDVNLDEPLNKQPRLESSALVDAVEEAQTTSQKASTATKITINETNDEETYFVLSLVGIFKRLSPHKRALAKCNILRYLTELEYGSSSIL